MWNEKDYTNVPLTVSVTFTAVKDGSKLIPAYLGCMAICKAGSLSYTTPIYVNIKKAQQAVQQLVRGHKHFKRLRYVTNIWAYMKEYELASENTEIEEVTFKSVELRRR